MIAVLGLLIGGAGNLTQTGVSAAIAVDLKDVNASGAKFFVVMAQALGAGGLIGIAVLVFAVSAITFRTGTFPAWLRVGWVVDGLLFLVAGYSIATTSKGISGFGTRRSSSGRSGSSRPA